MGGNQTTESQGPRETKTAQVCAENKEGHCRAPKGQLRDQYMEEKKLLEAG